MSLKAAVATVLDCRLPMYLAWGEGFIQIYNDAYRPILGAKHDSALGNAAPRTWHEIWPTIANCFGACGRGPQARAET